MRRVLLTGANTLVGSHILDRLLASTVSVRAVVASRDDAQSLQQCYSWAYPSQLDFAIVPAKETTTQGAYDNALRSHSHPFDAVVHTLAAEPSEGADCLSRFITLETEMLTSFLKSVRDVAGSVERVVFVTSLTPFARWLVDPSPLRNPVASTASSSRQPDIDVEYVLATSQASDNIVCDALWEWSKSARPRFDLVAISAPSIYGPSLRSLANSSDLQEANRRIWNMFSNDSRESISYPPYGIDFYADVRDLAWATVQAIFKPHARNRHFVLSAGAMPSVSAIAELLIGRFPELRGRVRSDLSSSPGLRSGDSPPDFVDTRLAATILGMVHYRLVEETLTDVAGQLLELHKRKEWKNIIQS